MGSSMRWRRVVAVALALAALLSGHASSHAAVPHQVTRVVEFVRTSTADSTHLRAIIDNGSNVESSLVGLWLLTSRGAVAQEPWLAVKQGGYQAPEARVNGQGLGCRSLPIQPAPVCESRIGSFWGVGLNVPDERFPDVQRVLAVIAGDDRVIRTRLLADSKGWRMRVLPNRVTLLRARDVSDTFVYSSSETVEHFTHASAEGSRAGSMTMAALPCRSAGSGPAAGYGGAVLKGGSAPKKLSCKEGANFMSAVARGATEWQLSGDVWGTTASGIHVTGLVEALTMSAEDVRLLVVQGPF